MTLRYCPNCDRRLFNPILSLVVASAIAGKMARANFYRSPVTYANPIKTLDNLRLD